MTCKLEHEQELELVCMGHENEVCRVKAQIEELTNLARVNIEQQSIPSRPVVGTRARNLRDHGQLPSTNFGDNVD